MGSNMKIELNDCSKSVVLVGTIARKLQAASASNDRKEMYTLATDIMLECQHIREHTQDAGKVNSIADYIRKVMK